MYRSSETGVCRSTTGKSSGDCLPPTSRMTLEEVVGAIQPLRACGPIPARTPIGQVTTDSREATPGGLFFALPGEKVDGAGFVEEAFRKGTMAAIVSEESAGKTSNKEMLAGLLSAGRNVLKNPGNRNNLIGMPLALLGLSDRHDVAVMEMGTNQPGEIARLAQIAAPDIGILTNIAPAHLQGLGSLEGVAREKGDLFRALPESGTAVVNATDLRVVREAGRCKARKIFFGVALNEFSGRILSMDDRGMRIAVRTPSGEFTSALPVTGEHHLMNALAAAAAAYVLGFRPEDLAEGFSSFASVRGRFHPIPLRSGGLLLDDSYNANPASMEAAIRALRVLRGARRSVAVLGDMLELGEASAASHFRIGHLIAGSGLDLLFTYGEEAAQVARGALEGGMDREKVANTGDRERLKAMVLGALREGDVVLVKGSRGMRLEEMAIEIERKWA